MKKLLLSLVAVLATVGAWAQEEITPVLSIAGLEDQAYPYALSDVDAQKIAALDDMTIVMTIKTSNLSGRQALICGADPTQAACTSGTKDNSPYFGYGFNGSNVGYLASSRGGDMFTMAGISANMNHYVVYVIDAVNGEVKAYVDGQIIHKNADETIFTNGDASGYQLQTFKKLFENETYATNAKIYLGGGKVTSNEAESNYETFNGKIYNFRVYDKVLNAEEVAQLCDMTKLAQPGNFYRISYNFTSGTEYLQGEASTVVKKKQVTPPASYAADAGANSIFYLANDGLISYSKGRYFQESGNNRGLQGVGVKQAVEIYPSKRDISKVVVKAGSFLHANTSGENNYSDHCTSNGDANHDHNLELVTSLPVSIGTTGYATFYAPVAVKLPDGLEAYYVSSKTTTSATLTQIMNVIPAETAVILKGTAGQTYDLAIGGEAEAVSGNILAGTIADTYITDNAYVLACVNEVTGFYKAEKNVSTDTANDDPDVTYESFVNNGFKAYLPVDVASARFLNFDFGTETGIESIEGENGNVKAEIYDLAGRRVQNAQKGLYIVNGKKVIK